MTPFSMAGGSITGTDHLLPGKPGAKNNQDAFVLHEAERFLAAVVCDGCGNSPYSEIGARVGASFAVRALERVFGSRSIDPLLFPGTLANGLDLAQTSVLNRITEEARAISGAEIGQREFAETIRDYFLFTVMGVVMTPSWTFIFSAGDGVFSVNGETTVIPPFAENAPPYIAYGLVPTGIDRALLRLVLRAQIPTDMINSILIGSDGVSHLMAAADQKLPGKEELVGPLKQFWTEKRFVKNPDAIRRRLALINLETIDATHEHPRIKPGLLPDDTTLVVIRHLKGENDHA